MATPKRKRPSWHTGDCYCYPQYHTNVALVWVDDMLFLRSQIREVRS